MPAGRAYLGSAVGFPLLAAFLWALYYILVLAATPRSNPSAVFVYPFLFGGVAYAAWTGIRGDGAAFLALWRSPAAWLRVGLLLGMQLSVLAGTYLIGPVDVSLLSLIGDVVITPIFVAAAFLEYRDRLGSIVLWTGMILCALGGALAIVGSGSVAAVRGWGYLLVITIPLTVAGYFLGSAREGERTSLSAVVAQSMLAAGIVGVAISPLLPGGTAGLALVDPTPLLLLVVTGLTSFFVAPLLYFDAIHRAGYVVPPLLMTGIPVFAGILSWGILSIPIPALGLVGIPVAVGGAILALRAETAAPSRAAAGSPPG
ncbi:MAG TPA: DMT family transporter [Thermoplasmata archaeon]|nr:DMT family transporter [Thermoplasmata archaeon]